MNLAIYRKIRQLPYDLQEDIGKYELQHWKYIYSRDVVNQLDECLKHRTYLYTENKLMRLLRLRDQIIDLKKIDELDELVIKPMMYKEVTTSASDKNVLEVTYYDSIEYNTNYRRDVIRSGPAYISNNINYKDCRPWKVPVFMQISMLANMKFYNSMSMQLELDQQNVYNEQLKLYGCPISGQLSKVTDYWHIGDKYVDHREYAHLLTKDRI